jgi:DNA-binding GntR family transcriptional regulator
MNKEDQVASVDSRIETRSLVELAAEAIRRQILSGTFAPGERLIEERLTEELAISRPPLREALRVLESEGLTERLPRRGTFVTTLDARDAHEILQVRSGLERMAFESGVPVTDRARLVPARAALERMQSSADAEDRGALVLAGYDFHFALVRISDNTRLQTIYASVQQQILLCMSRNLIARERYFEDLQEHVQRHRDLLDIVEHGSLHDALAALAAHGEGSFEAFADDPQATKPVAAETPALDTTRLEDAR